MHMPPSVASRAPDTEHASFAEDVAYYLSLTPRQLPSRYFYDELGSALFETICRLPWYLITRTERAMLQCHARAILSRTGHIATFIELGPGGGEKLLTLVAAHDRHDLNVHLVDVSPAALHMATRTLAVHPEVAVASHQATYEAGLVEFARRPRAGGRSMALFLGSNIGNFDAPGAAAFLHNVRAAVRAGDALLIGVDLVKPKERLLLAYDDPLGVTAAFNRNLIVRINRELGASIELEAFSHRAVWSEAPSRVEMHLVARRAVAVRIPRAELDLRLQPGEFIWTESSYKYVAQDVSGLLQSCGFRPTAQWIDRDDGFALTLAEAF